MARMAQPARYPAGAVILRQGEPGDAFYAILSGEARVRAVSEWGEERVLNYLSKGNFFGEISLLTGKPRSATIEAMTDIELAVFDKEAFKKMLAWHPSIRRYLIRTRIYFPGKRVDEIAEIYERKHPYALIESLIAPFFILIAWSALAWWGLLHYLGVSTGIFLIAFLPVLLISLGWIAWSYFDWINDYYIVTNKRVIHIERIFPIREERYEAPVDQVLDVKIVTPNVIAKLLGFMDVIIQTASMGTPIIFARLSEAESIQQSILEIRDKARMRHEAEERRRRRQMLQQRLGIVPPEEVTPPAPLEGEEAVPLPQKKPLSRILTYFLPRIREQRGNEIVWRKHWYILVKEAGLSFIVLLATVSLTTAIALGLSPIGFTTLGLSLPSPFFTVLCLVLSLVALGWFLWRYEDWRNDVYIVTDESIIDRESLPFGFRETKRLGSLRDIQNVSFTIPTFIARVLSMGDVFIDTKAGPGAFTFKAVYNPVSVQQEIFSRMMASQERSRQQEARQQSEEFSEWLSDYHKLISNRGQLPEEGPLSGPG